MATKSEDKPKEEKLTNAKATDLPIEDPLHGIEIKGEEKGGKNPTRLFQTEPSVKEWLTEDEAKAKGFYWKKD